MYIFLFLSALSAFSSGLADGGLLSATNAAFAVVNFGLFIKTSTWVAKLTPVSEE
jgi:hypothetical protein